MGRFASDGALLYSGAGLRLRVRNGATSFAGDDFAIDNMRVLDATPRVDKSFAPPDPGGTSRLTLTITNTDELASKRDWSFTDNLPAGLRVAGTPNLTTTCTSPDVSAAPNGPAIAVAGDLLGGQASCTAQVDVVADAPGTYLNGASNIALRVGVDPPAIRASVTFPPATTVSIASPPAGTRLTLGDVAPVRFVCSALVAVASCTATVRRPDGTVLAIGDGENIPADVPGTYLITATVVDVRGNRSTATRTYEVLAPAVPEVLAPEIPGVRAVSPPRPPPSSRSRAPAPA